MDPPRPSARLTQASGTLSEVASRRRSEPQKLPAMIRGELDWERIKLVELNGIERPGDTRFARDVCVARASRSNY